MKTEVRGPKPDFFWGHTKQFARDTKQFFVDLERDFPEGIAQAKIAFKDFRFIYHPKFVEHVLKSNYSNYTKSFVYDGMRMFLGDGLLTAEHDKWIKNRRTVQPTFSRRSLMDLAQLMDQTTRRLLNETKQGDRVNFTALFNHLTAGIVLEALFGESLDVHQGQVREYVQFLRFFADKKIKNPFMLPLVVPTSTNRKYKHILGKLNEIIYSILDRRMKGEEKRQDLLESLLDATQDWDSRERREQLRHELITLYIAGQETTSNAMLFFMDLIHRNPEAKKHLEDEVGSCWNGDDWNWEMLMGNAYLDHVVSEVLRMYPPAWAISREAIEEDQIEGVPIPKGTTIMISIYCMHHNEVFWGDPEVFRPERFETLDKKRCSYYLPFGSGPRACVGNHFALMEMKIIIANLIQHYSINVDTTKPLEIITPLTLSPAEDMIGTLKMSSR